jgi:hypothetical protein
MEGCRVCIGGFGIKIGITLRINLQ